MIYAQTYDLFPNMTNIKYFINLEQVQLRETLVSKSSLGDSGIDVNEALTKPTVTGSVFIKFFF